MPAHKEPLQNLILAGLNLIPQALSIYDKDLRLAVCNAPFREMFHFPRHLTQPGARFSDTVRYLTQRGEYGEIPDIDQYVQERVDQARAFAPHYMERTRANGRTIAVEGSPLRAGGWITVYTDITAIKRHEKMLQSHSAQLSDQLLSHAEDLARANRELAATVAQLEEVQRNLRESEALMRTTTEMMPAHIAHLDRNGIYTFSNRKLSSILPSRPAEIVGFHAKSALGDEAYSAIRTQLHQAYRGKASNFEFSNAENSRRIRVSFTPGYGGTDETEVTGVYVLSTDVTEETQARAALAQTRRRELAAQLTRGLAHDFSNLLTIILGLQGRLEKIDQMPDEALDLVAMTRAAALRGGVLLERISGISRQRELRPGATDMSSLLADIRAMAIPSLPDQVTLSCDCGDLDRPVLLDSGFLQDSLLNLILNARDAIGEGAGRIDISLRQIRESWLEILVCDSGPGFSAEALRHALDPFFSTKPNKEGSGLGLPMVFDFTQLSGGQIKIGNRKEGGAVITLRLPLAFAAEDTARRLVLLVEDDADIRANLRTTLRDLGHAVLEAESADEAETLAKVAMVDTVLTDMALRGTRSGLDLARALCVHNHKQPQIFMMTSLPPDDRKRRVAESEFPLIPKPFTQAELSHFLETGQPA
ncbi:MAG: PAS-domain containing protein [Paracoccaceae bacterium]